ncbi:MAG: serine O-acetyltransferase [Candidatus Obscuribacter sp.]|nr:serine O-acetyltransferase [Candidatus Obscuribacter sp.]MBK9772238.1 serine O-acetyltransferase [Candidatus Obscuribacter sp.]MBL0188433.1 serine O-acetyltransferase [Candidatus Obscuribacter sp.]MBP6349286.1 serine O-acetyltransferase [Candidatus Obscuribacter sp.]MBP6591685.1 serine O-acetyltransferase [Candidatus Obscuribacter sp.]
MYLRECIDNIYEQDPAARSRLEVVLCYPGFHVMCFHKLANFLWKKNVRTPARFVSHLARVLTGIEIHPGAKIGRRVFIDHGMGVVIGETAEIGDDCVIYQGVTLGAGAAARAGAVSRDTKRHPTLGQGVVVGSGAEIQGAIHVGDNVRVASGSILLKDVPANSVVVGVPGRVIYRDGKKIEKEQGDVPDIEAEAIKSLKEQIHGLESCIKEVRNTAKAQAREVKTLRAQLLQEGRSGEELASGTDYQALPSEVARKNDDDGSDPVDVFLQGAGI